MIYHLANQLDPSSFCTSLAKTFVTWALECFVYFGIGVLYTKLTFFWSWGGFNIQRQ